MDFVDLVELETSGSDEGRDGRRREQGPQESKGMPLRRANQDGERVRHADAMHEQEQPER